MGNLRKFENKKCLKEVTLFIEHEKLTLLKKTKSLEKFVEL